ncbi:MAG: SH3 domain-containing protein [Oligoflexales bacterium]|nr:SH3 domain-containing protein [Oligoflexales bacterium]
MTLKIQVLLTSIALCFGLQGCSFFWGEEEKDPISKVVKQESPEPTPAPPQDQWVEEEDLPRGPGSTATEAVNEVMDQNISINTRDYVEGPGEFWVRALALNIRSGPSYRYQKVGTLKKGTKVLVLERRGSWIRIEANQWISKHFLSTEP